LNAHPAWWKIEALEKYLKEYEWIWCLDLDAFIMNPNKNIDFVTKMITPDKDVVIARDYEAFVVNAGSFFIRNTSYMSSFVKDWLSMHTKPIDLNEQGAFASLYSHNHNRIAEKTAILQLRAINSYCQEHIVKAFQYQPGDFVVHFPGQCKSKLESFVQKMGPSLVY
jgi:hypothetical protein